MKKKQKKPATAVYDAGVQVRIRTYVQQQRRLHNTAVKYMDIQIWRCRNRVEFSTILNLRIGDVFVGMPVGQGANFICEICMEDLTKLFIIVMKF